MAIIVAVPTSKMFFFQIPDFTPTFSIFEGEIPKGGPNINRQEEEQNIVYMNNLLALFKNEYVTKKDTLYNRRR